AVNAAFNPDINTGEYGDSSFRDEFAWAAAELFATTREDSFLTAVDVFFAPNYTVPYWGRVETLGYYTLFRMRNQFTGIGAQYAAQALSKVMALASGVNANASGTAYGVAMGKTSDDFVWGSNAVASNQGIALIYGYLASGDRKYIEMALANLDYLLGRNATSYSFVTGHGDKTPRFPHHRQSGSDGIPDPIPGLLVGGPNPDRQDGCVYPSTYAAESYSDTQCSYASNENAINWSAAFGYFVTAIEALKSDAGFTSVAVEPPEHDFGAVPAIKSVFPNPFREQATISFTVDRPQRVQVDVTDQLGRRVGVVRQMEVRSGSNQTVVDGQSLPPGVYFVTLTGERFRESFKFVQLR
ncbi:MAG TPA: glycoside hydrolase family 9 protein, partial [Rhodothermales bacterium]